MRSKLFVPGARPDFFAKALAGDADAVSFDLEDSVPEDGKAVARARVAEFLRSDAVRASRKTIIVRVNAFHSPDFAEDIAALADVRFDLVNVPKILDGAEAREAATTIKAALGGERGGLLANIETPGALARAAEIAGAHPMIRGLQIGLNDLFAPLGIRRRNLANVHAALWAVRMASGEAGAFAYDGAYANVDDAAGYRCEAELARNLGFLGKSCIHPSQVAIANDVFDGADDELDEARRIVAAARAAAKEGRGAFLLDGRMIDLPDVTRAQALLAEHGL